MSWDRLSANLVPLILRLAYGSSPEMLIVDLIHLVSHEMDVLLRLWLACSTGFTTSHLRYRWKAGILLFPMVHHGPTLNPCLVIGLDRKGSRLKTAKCFLSKSVTNRNIAENVRSSGNAPRHILCLFILSVSIAQAAMWLDFT